MHYLVAGILKPGNNERLVALHDEFNDHIGQSSGNISLFGLLRDVPDSARATSRSSRPRTSMRPKSS